jgi:hypothetical protein
MKEAKQMTMGQPVGAASHMADGFSSAVRISSKSLSSRSGFFWIRLRPRFSGGVFECSSRMKGNFQVRFLEGRVPAMAPGYSTVETVRRYHGPEDLLIGLGLKAKASALA